MQLEVIPVPNFEKVVYCEDKSSRLRAMVSIHNTALGPSCGGVRMLPYASKEKALEDVLRLSRGMSFKSSLAGIGFGGGKSVIIGDPRNKTPELMQAMGEFIDSFGGSYIAAKDMNVVSSDLLEIRKKTTHVLGIEGVEGSCDPSPVTALGVYRAFEAVCERQNLELSDLKVAIQGIGYVGYDLAKRLTKAGAKIWVCDPNSESLQKAGRELGATVVGLDEIYDVDCDIFCPCAVGATLNEETIPRLTCSVVLGAANNQLKTPEDGVSLHQKGILYVPDFLVNSGGIISVFAEYSGFDESRAFKMTDGIHNTVLQILERSHSENDAPFLVADKIAIERISG